MSDSPAPDGGRGSSDVLDPITLNGTTIRNRVVFAACVNNLGTNHEINDKQTDFYRERAAGGVGAVITEGLSVHYTSVPNPAVPLAFDRALLPGLTRLSSAVHAEGAAILGQLWHVGRNALWSAATESWAPSALPDPYSGTYPHAMSDSEIESVIKGFALTAANLADAGFEGVEIHGAHGYLVNQFLSPWSNLRDDKWGVDLPGRSRFLINVIREIRAACPPNFIVGLKLTGDEGVDGGIGPDQAAEIAKHLHRHAPPDFIAVSQGNFTTSLERHVPDNRFGIGLAAGLASGIRSAVNAEIPVMMLGRIPTLEHAAEAVASGSADLVGMVRPLIADPELVNKTVRGEPVRPCVFCNTCWDRIHRNQPITCLYAPSVGANTPPPRSSSSRMLHVVGAGPAGLEVARSAAESGYSVVVHEAADTPGGRLAVQALLPGRREVAAATEWLFEAARRAGAEFRFNDPVTPESIASWDTADVVVQAHGAVPVPPAVAGAPRTISVEDAIAQWDRLRGPVLVVDDDEDEPVYAAAEFFATGGLEVTIVTRRPSFARKLAYVSQIGIYRRLYGLGVELVPDSEVIRYEDGRAVFRDVYAKTERPGPRPGTVVCAGPYRPRPAFDLGGRAGVVIGDAYAPRSVTAVTAEARAVTTNLIGLMRGGMTTGAPRAAVGPGPLLRLSRVGGDQGNG